MALNSCLPVVTTLMLAFLLLINQGGPSSAGRPQLFWVATDKAQCSNYSNGSDCDTLEGYELRKDVNFSLSNTTWVFLHGTHEWGSGGSSLIIVGVRNVTFKGEEKCAMEVEKCVLVMQYMHSIASVLVEQSSDVTFANLILQYVGTIDGRVNVSQTSNFHVYSVHFRYTNLVIHDPFGDYTIEGSQFGPWSRINTELSACPCASERKCKFTFTVKECKLEMEYDSTTDSSSGFVFGKDGYPWPTGIAISMLNQTYYHSIGMFITNSIFTNSDFTVIVRNYPTSSLAVEIKNVTFNRCLVNVELPLMKTVTYSEEARVLINESNFIVSHDGKLDICLWPNLSQDSLGKVSTQHPEIVIANSNFQDDQLAQHEDDFDIYPYILRARITHNLYLPEAKPRPLLTILRCTFKRTRRDVVLELSNLQGYRVLLAGGNRIISNEGMYLQMSSTQVELHGYNEISSNKFAPNQLGGGIYLSSDSQLLLTPHSFLNVSANRGDPYGGGIYIDYKGRGVQTLNEFVDCYVDKLTCPGWCFFQFINSDGQYVNASDIAEHNTSAILSHNTATYGGNNVFNAHFQNCILWTAHGTTPASRELILNVFQQYPPMDEEAILSFPYAICLCDGDELNCIRNNKLVIETYPVRRFPIFVTVLGDWQREIPVKLTVAMAQSEKRNNLDIKGCTRVHTVEHPNGPAPGSRHELLLEASLDVSDNFKRILVIHVFNDCSPGLQYIDQQCICNPFLKQHHFTCTIMTTTTTYKAEWPYYWIGIVEEHVMLSPSCPIFFCNSALQSGLALDNNSDGSLQCSNGRQGLLCSECPSGYSSVFGSFKCKECSSVWLLQLPLYALGGIFIVALLFLFNLTLLQGTIMGVVLYTNIIGLMGDFLQEHAWGPLFFLLSVLNLQSGAGVCFYNGMDEFWKALLQFAFPFYLFTLLIVIIIVTHKCGYRMFRRARFIARRAVPVLATIMVLTYTSLVNAVITPLRYTTIYNTTTAQGQTVWLYQPSLPFFGGQHLVLGILSIAVTVLYLIPFTFTMLFGDLMRRYFHKLWFSHFMDVLHGGFRWPLGFWIGLRLLVRVILVVANITTNPNTSAFCTMVTAGTLLVVQLLVRPFRDPSQFREDVHAEGPPSCKRKCLTQIKKFLNTYHAPLFETMYLVNIVQMSAMFAFGSHSETVVLSAAGVNILIIMALVQFAVTLVYHAYNFFPVPERARSCAQSCWSTMRTIPSMLKDTQCCRRGPREEEEPRRSPIPILILRPPEVDESYESESETSSYDEHPPPEEVEFRESSLHEPLLTSCD